MKKITYFIVTAAALSIAACSGGSKHGYTITGSVDGAADGDTVFLQEAAGRDRNNLDTAIIKNGSFTFEGQQDSIVNRYITCQINNEMQTMDFFLENGLITVALSKDNDSATGTPNNDAYQQIRSQINAIIKKMNTIYEALGDSTLTEEQKEAKKQAGNQLEEEYYKVLKEGVQKNITKPVGVHLFLQSFYNNTTAENEALLQQIPAEFQKNERIQKIKEFTEKQKKTAVGTHFIDFEMKDMNDKTVKLSDYVGKGKVVLVDFWASWCGPCRQEMPNLVKAYAKYKNKNFEIVGVSLDQEAQAWKDASKKLQITWPQMSDLKYWNSEGAQLYAVNSIPHTILIDAKGTIIARGLHGEELQNKLAEILE